MKYAYVYDGSKHELKEFNDPAPEQKEVEKTRIVSIEETDDEGLPITVEKEETYTETETYQPEFDYDKAAADYQSCVWLSEEEYNRFKNADVTKYHLEWDDEHNPVLAEYGKQQWVEMKDGRIVASAGYRFSETCIKAEKPVVRGYDGGMYYEDDLPEKPQSVINAERITALQNRLDETDWYAVRYAETGVEIPDNIKAERQSAREEISRLRGDDV